MKPPIRPLKVRDARESREVFHPSIFDQTIFPDEVRHCLRRTEMLVAKYCTTVAKQLKKRCVKRFFPTQRYIWWLVDMTSNKAYALNQLASLYEKTLKGKPRMTKLQRKLRAESSDCYMRHRYINSNA